jgi:AcrR family transcriptional regulator
VSKGLREQVLESAVAYIARNGPDGLSFRQIAADAGVSHQAPYHHFGDRKAIFQAIALEGFEMLADSLSATEAPGVEPSVMLCERYVEFALAHKGHFRVMFRTDLCSMDESPALQQAGDNAFQALLDEVTKMVGDGASLEDVRVQTTAMWSLAHGLATLLIDGPLENKIGRVADRKALVRAVAQRMGEGLLQPRRDIST